MQQELPLEIAPEPAPKPKRPRAPRKPSPPVRANMRLTAWIALAVIVLDQALKYLVVHGLHLDEVRNLDVFPPWLNLRMAWNQGVNFGLMASDQRSDAMDSDRGGGGDLHLGLDLDLAQCGRIAGPDRGGISDRRGHRKRDRPDLLWRGRGFPEHVAARLAEPLQLQRRRHRDFRRGHRACSGAAEEPGRHQDRLETHRQTAWQEGGQPFVGTSVKDRGQPRDGGEK